MKGDQVIHFSTVESTTVENFWTLTVPAGTVVTAENVMDHISDADCYDRKACDDGGSGDVLESFQGRYLALMPAEEGTST